MAEWKKEIRTLCKDFCIPKETYARIIKQTENNKREMPGFYASENDYKYDTAYAQLKSYILA